MKLFFSLLFILTTGLFVSAQTFSPKFEFRAVWVATVANIDWPSKPGLPTEEQQQEVIDILNMHEQLGMNVIILQVRPTADAFYPSALEPWSRYLTERLDRRPNRFTTRCSFG